MQGRAFVSSAHPFWEQDYRLIHTTACQGRKVEWRNPRHTNKRCDYMSKIVGKRGKQAKTDWLVSVKSLMSKFTLFFPIMSVLQRCCVAWQQSLFRWDAKPIFQTSFVITLKSSIWDFWIKRDFQSYVYRWRRKDGYQASDHTSLVSSDDTSMMHKTRESTTHERGLFYSHSKGKRQTRKSSVRWRKRRRRNIWQEEACRTRRLIGRRLWSVWFSCKTKKKR